MKTQPAWLNKELFPFESKWAMIDGHSMHYIDEGPDDQQVPSVETILFVHGTPEWSFGFRDLVKGLKKDFRCVAIDHLGFGLSDKKEGVDYSVEAHSKRLTLLIEKLSLKNITIIANDFGGGISMGYAVQHPGNVRAVVLFNTWMWSLKNDPHFSKPARMIDSWFGRFLYKTMNAPVNMIMPSAFGDKKKLTPEAHRHYKNVVPDATSRVALYAIALQLMGASDWWQQQWDKLSVIENKPIMIFWGMKDKFVPPTILKKWRDRLPKARVVEYEDAGHFVQEEKADEMTREISAFLRQY
ncbi:MAG TPA: alpha/beta fold hydrolase [Cyclobacteriaceae bacterium]|nr:alpha/beta fold hydrolase [Cyclobacteriaceae bacterium]